MQDQSPVALEGTGALQVVHIVREHEDHKVPQSSLIRYPPVLMESGRQCIITHVISCGVMKLTGSSIFCPAQHLETVTKIKTVKSEYGGLP